MNRRDLLRLLSCAPLLSLPAPASAAEELKFSELYDTGVTLSAKAKALSGKRVVMSGFMAPPLKVEASFFVLTGIPMAVCPFCDTELDWPSNIALVRTPEQVEFVPFNRRISVEGVLETGFAKDAETGFVSFIRLIDAAYSVA